MNTETPLQADAEAVISEAIELVRAVDDLEPEFQDDDLWRAYQQQLSMVAPLREAIASWQRANAMALNSSGTEWLR